MSKTLKIWLRAQRMSEMNEVVGPEGLEPSTKGFTLSWYFYQAWTISSPAK